MPMSAETVEVTIFGKEYPVITSPGKDAQYISKLAQYVDIKMKEIAEQAPNISSMGVAVLACLNISDEMFSSRSDFERDIKSVDEVVNLLIKDIDIRITGLKNS